MRTQEGKGTPHTRVCLEPASCREARIPTQAMFAVKAVHTGMFPWHTDILCKVATTQAPAWVYVTLGGASFLSLLGLRISNKNLIVFAVKISNVPVSLGTGLTLSTGTFPSGTTWEPHLPFFLLPVWDKCLYVALAGLGIIEITCLYFSSARI